MPKKLSNFFHAKYFYLFLGIAWVIRALLIIGFDPETAGVDGQLFYLPAANNLLEHGILSHSPHEPYVLFVHKTPGYIFFITIIFWLFNKSLLAVRLIQLHLDGLTVLMVYLLAARLKDKPTAGLAALLYIIMPYNAFYTWTIIRGIPGVFLLVLSTYFWVRSFQTKKIIYFVLGMFITALSIYFREDAYYYFIFFGLAWLFNYFRSQYPPLVSILCIPLILFFTLSPWIIRNWINFNDFIPMGVMKFSRNIVVSNVAHSDETSHLRWKMLSPEDGQKIQETDHSISTTPEYQIPYAVYKEGFKIYDKMGRKYLRHYWKDFLFYVIPTNLIKYITSPRFDRIQHLPPLFPVGKGFSQEPILYIAALFSRFLHTALYVFGFLGLCILARSQISYWFLPMMAIFPALAVAIIGQSNPRYELQVLPLLMIGMAIFLSWIYQHCHKMEKVKTILK